MTTTAKSAAPPHAIKIWSDGLRLYAELPGNPPYVQCESACEAGLWKLLNLLRSKAKSELPIAAEPVKDSVFVPKRPLAEVKATEDQRLAARDVLRKMGML